MRCLALGSSLVVMEAFPELQDPPRARCWVRILWVKFWAGGRSPCRRQRPSRQKGRHLRSRVQSPVSTSASPTALGGQRWAPKHASRRRMAGLLRVRRPTMKVHSMSAEVCSCSARLLAHGIWQVTSALNSFGSWGESGSRPAPRKRCRGGPPNHSPLDRSTPDSAA